MSRQPGIVSRALRHRFTVLALAVVGAAAGTAPRALAQDEGGIPVVADTTWEEHVRPPIGYQTSYDLNTSTATWVQNLNYRTNTRRVAFGTNASMMTLRGVGGFGSDGITGDVLGSLDVRATNNWIWSLVGTFGTVSQSDASSNTDLRRNSLQIRTQYSTKPVPQLSLAGYLYTGLEQNQSVGTSTIPGTIDDLYLSQATHDSSYSSGRGDGFSGNATWTPAGYARWYVVATATRNHTTTHNLSQESFVGNPDQGTESRQTDSTTVQIGTPDSRNILSRFTYTGLRKTTAELTLRGQASDQQYFALNVGKMEQVTAESRNGAFHLEHNPVPGGRLALDVSAGRLSQTYQVQTSLSTQVYSKTLTAAAGISRVRSRGNLSFDLSRTDNDRQNSQNGTTINRTLNAGGWQRATSRLYLDANASISLLSRTYTHDEPGPSVSDEDDQRANLNVGGGYVISRACSTAVHFSVNRGHNVAPNELASANNNVQTTYQMDALLRLQLSSRFLLTQNYQLNASYFIYDYTIHENNNTLTRNRRIDTVVTDSLFPGVWLRLAHNFQYLDRGGYSAQGDGGGRLYVISTETYHQILALGVGVSPVQGVFLNATESIDNSKFYNLSTSFNIVSNVWNLNLGATVNRQLPAGIALNGSIQHIGQYTEVPVGAPPGAKPDGVNDFWLVGVGLTKEF